MNLLGYNAGSHNSAIEAQQQGALHHLTILNDIDDATLTLEDLNNLNLMTELNNAWEFANNAFGIMGYEGEIVAVLEDIDGKLVYEMANDGSWFKIQTLAELNIDEVKKSLACLEAGKFKIYVIRLDKYLYKINVLDLETGKFTTQTTELGDDREIELAGETFDYYLNGNYDDGLFIDLYNLITDKIGSGGGMIHNPDFNFAISPIIVTSDEFKTIVLETKEQLIDAQLKNIEKWAGEAYQSPACTVTNGQGDEVWQSLYEIRKIIGIGTSEYAKELEDAKTN